MVRLRAHIRPFFTFTTTPDVQNHTCDHSNDRCSFTRPSALAYTSHLFHLVLQYVAQVKVQPPELKGFMDKKLSSTSFAFIPSSINDMHQSTSPPLAYFFFFSLSFTPLLHSLIHPLTLT